MHLTSVNRSAVPKVGTLGRSGCCLKRDHALAGMNSSQYSGLPPGTIRSALHFGNRHQFRSMCILHDQPCRLLEAANGAHQPALALLSLHTTGVRSRCCEHDLNSVTAFTHVDVSRSRPVNRNSASLSARFLLQIRGLRAEQAKS